MPATQVKPQAQPISVSIDMEGDSTVYGDEWTGAQYIQTPNNVPVELQADLQSTLGPTVTVENNGHPGASVLNDVDGWGANYTTPLATRLATDPSKIVTGTFGINDATNFTVDEYGEGLIEFINIVRQAGKIPVLIEPNPTCGTAAPKLAQYVSTMDSVAAGQNVLLVKQWAYIQTLPDWQSFLLDCTHPNDGLYALEASRDAAALAPLVMQEQ
jgi:lysophospholipase L1-like esterase